MTVVAWRLLRSDSMWHSDITWRERPSLGSVMRAIIEVPDELTDGSTGVRQGHAVRQNHPETRRPHLQVNNTLTRAIKTDRTNTRAFSTGVKHARRLASGQWRTPARTQPGTLTINAGRRRRGTINQKQRSKIDDLSDSQLAVVCHEVTLPVCYLPHPVMMISRLHSLGIQKIAIKNK